MTLTAVLFLMGSHIEIKRGPDGKWSFFFKKEPTDSELLIKVLDTVSSWLGVKAEP